MDFDFVRRSRRRSGLKKGDYYLLQIRYLQIQKYKQFYYYFLGLPIDFDHVRTKSPKAKKPSPFRFKKATF